MSNMTVRVFATIMSFAIMVAGLIVALLLFLLGGIWQVGVSLASGFLPFFLGGLCAIWYKDFFLEERKEKRRLYVENLFNKIKDYTPLVTELNSGAKVTVRLRKEFVDIVYSRTYGNRYIYNFCSYNMSGECVSYLSDRAKELFFSEEDKGEFLNVCLKVQYALGNDEAEGLLSEIEENKLVL